MQKLEQKRLQLRFLTSLFEANLGKIHLFLNRSRIKVILYNKNSIVFLYEFFFFQVHV